MTLRGLPFLLDRPALCEVFGISRWTLRHRLAKDAYPLLVWVNETGTPKVTRPSVEKQLDAMLVKV